MRNIYYPSDIRCFKMRVDKRQECSKCEEYLEKNEFVHKVTFGNWSVKDNEFERGGEHHIYCRDCWSEMKPMLNGTQYEPDSPESLKNVIRASKGDLVADFGALIIGSRVYLSYIGGSWKQCTVKNRMIGENVIGSNAEFEDIEEVDLDEFLSNVMEDGDLPSIVGLIPSEKTPFDQYPEFKHSQSHITDF